MFRNKTKVEKRYNGNDTMIVPAAEAALAVAYSPTQKLQNLFQFKSFQSIAAI